MENEQKIQTILNKAATLVDPEFLAEMERDLRENPEELRNYSDDGALLVPDSVFMLARPSSSRRALQRKRKQQRQQRRRARK